MHCAGSAVNSKVGLNASFLKQLVDATDLKKSVSPKAFFDAVISDGVVLNGKTGINTLLHIDDQDLYAVIGGEKSEFSGYKYMLSQGLLICCDAITDNKITEEF